MVVKSVFAEFCAHTRSLYISICSINICNLSPYFGIGKYVGFTCFSGYMYRFLRVHALYVTGEIFTKNIMYTEYII